MSEQWWAPLVGVVIGGILGGVAQIVAGTMQERRRHKQWLREQRTEVYRNFLTEWRKRELTVMDDVFDDLHVHGEAPEDYLIPLFDRAEEIGVFGSPKAIVAAKRAAEDLMTLWGANRTTRDDKLKEADASMRTYREVIRDDLHVG